MYEYNARIRRVIDGDTVEADVDLGFNIWIRSKIRLLGIDAPERGEVGYDGSRNWLSRILINDARGYVVLKTEKDRTGKYGRMLGILYTGQLGEKSVNTELVDSGHAKFWS